MAPCHASAQREQDDIHTQEILCKHNEPRPEERILDLGCGDGVLTEKILETGCTLLAVDSSPEQVAAARARGIDARVADAQQLPIMGELDAVLSNAVMFWVKNQGPYLRSVYRILKPAGRFVYEFARHGCVSIIRSAIHSALSRRDIAPTLLDPWYFPTEEEYCILLQRHGFTVKLLTLFPRPTPRPGDVGHWLDIFAQPFLAMFADDERRTIIDEIREALRPQLYDETHGLVTDYVRIQFAGVRVDEPITLHSPLLH